MHLRCTRQLSAPVALVDVVTGLAPAHGTSVRVAHDGVALCIRFECDDDDPWATITERDGPLWEEEVVEVFIDPIGDGECYFELELNPLGTVLDLVCRRNRSGYRKDFAWDCEGLHTAVERTSDGWSAEFTIPFASIATTAPQAGDRWRVNFCRIDRPNRLRASTDRELTAWSPTGMPQFHTPHRFGTIEFGE